MLSHPAQNLHTDTGPNRRQQPTLPTAYDCSSKIPSPPTSPTDHSNLTRFRTAIRHEQVQSYESARAEDAIRLQQKYRSRPGSREGNQPINDAGCQDDHQQQHKIREAQQQRQARPGHYQYHQHQNTNEEQQDNQRTIRPSTSIGLEQHRGGRQRRARPKSIAILPAGLDDPHLHQWSPSGDASHQRLGNWAEEAAAFHSVASGESLSRSQTFIDSLSHDRSWDLTHQYGSQARAEILPHSASTTGGTPGLSRAKTITPMHQYMQRKCRTS